MTSPLMKTCNLELKLSSPLDFALVAAVAEPVLAIASFVVLAPFPVVVAAPPPPALTLAAEMV